MDIESYLQKIVATFRMAMKDNLVGIYLHGSLAMGCFNPNNSDIDLLIVAKNKLSIDEQKAITKHVLLLHNDLPSGRGIELSIVLESFVKNFVYPTPFEYHYSDYHREKYQSDESYVCGGFEDPDLAAHFTVTFQRGITLHGRPIQILFQPIDKKYYMQSILNDIREASKEIIDSPVYYALNLCRVLLFLQEGVVSSKKEGGEWGLKVLPRKFQFLISNCLDEYNGLVNEPEFDGTLLVEFSEYMQNEIRQLRD
ncbi:aminoglycoside adenylyltransferase domain-containing protein [Brevibacillus sp. SAFN-007a]